jgi:D-lyxose ketol-isomerase
VERWGYNVGDTSVTLSWGSHTATLEPGDSFFICPGVTHTFGGTGKVLVMEIKPDGSNPLDELALIKRYSGTRGLERVHSENTQWF